VEVRDEVRQLAEPLAEEHGYELVDIEQASNGHHRVIRIYLDKPGGVTLDDCARFSRHLADAMDMNQIVPGAYHLEVSSPGLERPSGRSSTCNASADKESICICTTHGRPAPLGRRAARPRRRAGRRAHR